MEYYINTDTHSPFISLSLRMLNHLPYGRVELFSSFTGQTFWSNSLDIADITYSFGLHYSGHKSETMLPRELQHSLKVPYVAQLSAEKKSFEIGWIEAEISSKNLSPNLFETICVTMWSIIYICIFLFLMVYNVVYP